MENWEHVSGKIIKISLMKIITVFKYVTDNLLEQLMVLVGLPMDLLERH